MYIFDRKMSSYEDFTQMTGGELRCYLAERALRISGVKQELIARAFTAMENDVQLVKSSELEKQLKAAYEARWKGLGLDADPLENKSLTWNSTDITLWPNIDLGKIFHFIISKKQHNIDIIGHYKTHKAYSWYGRVPDLLMSSLFAN